MTIEILYDAGDEVFYMQDNKAKTGIVDEIRIIRALNAYGVPSSSISYSLKHVNHRLFFEYELFPTKEALIESL